MLILTRKIGETVRIGDDITVKVLALRGGQISLGFTAPNDVRIFREEILFDSAPAPATIEPVQAKPPARERLDRAVVRDDSSRRG